MSGVEDVKYEERKKERERKNVRRKQQQLIEGARRRRIFFRDVSDALAQFFARRTSDEDVVFLRFRCSNSLPLFPIVDAEIQLVEKIWLSPTTAILTTTKKKKKKRDKTIRNSNIISNYSFFFLLDCLP
jgi:hypothetical protein